MSNYKKISITILLFAGLYFFLDFSSDELKLRKDIKTMRELAEISTGEHPFNRLKVAKQLSAYVSDSLVINFKAPDMEHEPVEIDRKRIIEQKIVMIRSYLKFLKIVLQSVDIEIDGDKAKARLKINAYGQIAQNEEDFFDRHLVEIKFVRVEDEWKVYEATHLENLRGESGI